MDSCMYLAVMSVLMVGCALIEVQYPISRELTWNRIESILEVPARVM